MSLFINFVVDNIITIIIFIIPLWLMHQYLRQRRLPPGPWGWPVVGNLMLLLLGDKRETFRKLRERYGDLVSLSVGSQTLLIVSGVEMLHEVFVNVKDFDKRPQVFTVLKVGQGKAVLNASGKVWKEHRTFLLEHMNDLGIGKTRFEGNVLQEIQPFIRLLENTNGADFDIRYSIQTAMSNIICSISFGKRFEYDDSEFNNLLNIFDDNMKISGAGTSLVNYFPFLEYLPGDPFKCGQCLDNVAKVQAKISAWIDHHKATLDPDHPRDFIDYYLLEMRQKVKEHKNTTMDESQLLKFVGDLFVAGTETTATTIRWALAFLVRHPDVQHRLFQEIAQTLGPRAQLSIQDKSRMPYTQAVILEIQRLGDIAPFSFPRTSFVDVQLGKYLIPAGTLVIPNINSVHMDPQIWNQPREFRPSRFLDDSGKLVNRTELMPFFIGSRMCPGRSLGKMELFHFITSIVHAFDILPAQSEDLPSLDGHVGVTNVPHPFKVKFVKRTSCYVNKIRNGGKGAKY